MLAYVFWHTPAQRSSLTDYASGLVAFHRALASAASEGFIRSEVHRLASAPWLPGAPVFEDWYLLRDSAALDPLDESAVGARMKTVHDAIAARAGAGTAGLYRCRVEGEPLLRRSSARWFSKPVGTMYSEFLPPTRAAIPRGGWLWQRKMTLGPTPEFCAIARGELPDLGTASLVLNREVV